MNKLILTSLLLRLPLINNVFAFCFLFSVFCFLPSALFAQTKADTIHVSHYDIHLEIRDFDKEEIKGYTDVSITSKIAPLANINLDFFALTVDSIKKGSQTLTFLHEGHNLRIDVPFSTVGQNEMIRVYYHGKPEIEDWGGFIFDGDFAFNIGVGMSTNPHAIGRFWYPCIDDFTDKSTYTFNITTDVDKKAVCGGILVDSTNLGDAMHWKWVLTDPIPTYLASVAVGNYQVYKDTVHSIAGNILPIEIYADSATIIKVPGSFINLKKFIHTFEKRWGACRWQRVGYVVVPFPRGNAMEHATNIAYPQPSVTGSTADQGLISHELAHSWFGNLITCATAQNMWINEGFATYGAILCDEMLDPTLQTFKKEITKLHANVLKNAHGNDGDYFALDNVPIHKAYGTTTYEKGGLVAHTLRGYMGDNLFFSAITQFLDEHQYKNVDSEEFFNKLSHISGLDLTDFYLAWVHQPGFLNFNIDSIKHKMDNIYEVSFKQKLHNANYFADNNLIDVEFVSATGERYLVERNRFSGEQEIVDVEIPFEPVFWAIDPNEKLGDACFKFSQIFNKTGNVYLLDAGVRIQVKEIEGEAILRVEHNLVAPTSKNQSGIIRISKRFWRIGFLTQNTMQATYSFIYNTNTYDKELLQEYSINDLILLYRKDASDEWQKIPTTTVVENTFTGRLNTNSILPGEYALAIGKGIEVTEWENEIFVYPNPATKDLRVTSYDLQIDTVEIFDVNGKNFGIKFPSNKLKRWQQQADGVVFNISHLPNGTYFVQIHTDKGIITKKIVKL